MSIDRSYIARTTASRERPEEGVGRLRDRHYGRDAGAGWTISALLAHLACWERRTLERLKRWERAGFTPPAVGADPINDAARPGWRASPGNAAATEVLAAARVT